MFKGPPHHDDQTPSVKPLVSTFTDRPLVLLTRHVPLKSLTSTMVHGPLFFPLLVCGSFFDFYESLPLRDSFSFRPRYVKTTTLSDSRSPLPVHPLGRSCHLQFGSFLEKFSLQLYGVIKDEFLSWDPFYKLKRFRITVVFVVCYHRFRS